MSSTRGMLESRSVMHMFLQIIIHLYRFSPASTTALCAGLAICFPHSTAEHRKENGDHGGGQRAGSSTGKRRHGRGAPLEGVAHPGAGGPRSGFHSQAATYVVGAERISGTEGSVSRSRLDEEEYGHAWPLAV